MKKNTDLKELGSKLFSAGSVVIFPHVNPDGDAVGAGAALCLALRKSGVESYVYSEGIPAYLGFLDAGIFTDDYHILPPPDICIAIDCSEDSRLNERVDAFNEGDTRMCIDHHLNDIGYGDYYYIDEKAAAVCEIIYEMLVLTGIDIDRSIANALYTGLSTDTGNFKYSNTTAATHRTAARLMDIGIDHTEIMVRLYQNKGMKKLLCESRAVERMQMFAEGKGVISYLTSRDLAEMDAKSEDADEIIDVLRNISGVEMAAYLEERENGIKVSMRAKTYGNVAEICKRYDGGGHVKAAGCTLKTSMEKAYSIIKLEIEKAV